MLDYPVWDIAVHLAVAGGVYDVFFLCCPFSPRDFLDEILDLIESVSESFLPTLQIIFEKKSFQNAAELCILISLKEKDKRCLAGQSYKFSAC